MILIKIRPSIVLVDKDNVLLMKYIYSGAEVWGIPGGGVAESEDLLNALMRELDEELGVTIKVENLLCVVETPTTGTIKHTLHCVFVGSVAGGTPTLNPEHTSALAVEWIHVEDINDKILYPPINDVIKLSVYGIVRPNYLGVRYREWL